uniref:Uncharacterized protein n=1 Tax=Oryza sativa subsp. japonica TaxID=39947 RepID=Q6K6S7_ORYSJ|nr:hypothetical protein [Oryza sativa Japonica Group]BAD21969.1 hypothetical protein [Oryza sativa Japonica Group]
MWGRRQLIPYSDIACRLLLSRRHPVGRLLPFQRRPFVYSRRNDNRQEKKRGDEGGGGGGEGEVEGQREKSSVE